MGHWKKVLMQPKSVQKAMKPKRRLKKDVIADLCRLLGVEKITNIDRLTIQGIDELIQAIERKLTE